MVGQIAAAQIQITTVNCAFFWLHSAGFLRTLLIVEVVDDGVLILPGILGILCFSQCIQHLDIILFCCWFYILCLCDMNTDTTY